MAYDQAAVVSYQWSVISGQLSVVSCQLSVVSEQWSVVKQAIGLLNLTPKPTGFTLTLNLSNSVGDGSKAERSR